MNKPYELEGRFFVAKLNKRRHLCFQRNDGTLGASASFSRREAYENARPKPVPDAGTLEDTFTAVLRARGFVVTGSHPEMNEPLADAVENMLFK